jgi:hypothetical protein
MLKLKYCPGDEKQTCPGGQGSGGSGYVQPSRCEAFGGDGSGHDGHYSEIHDTDDQKNHNEPETALDTVKSKAQSL